MRFCSACRVFSALPNSAHAHREPLPISCLVLHFAVLWYEPRHRHGQGKSCTYEQIYAHATYIVEIWVCSCGGESLGVGFAKRYVCRTDIDGTNSYGNIMEIYPKRKPHIRIAVQMHLKAGRLLLRRRGALSQRSIEGQPRTTGTQKLPVLMSNDFMSAFALWNIVSLLSRAELNAPRKRGS